jgi:hypothetical protein
MDDADSERLLFLREDLIPAGSFDGQQALPGVEFERDTRTDCEFVLCRRFERHAGLAIPSPDGFSIVKSK